MNILRSTISISRTFLQSTLFRCFCDSKRSKKMQLSRGAIEKLASGEECLEPITIQVIARKRVGGKRYRLLISDGLHAISFVLIRSELAPELEDMSIIRVYRYKTHVVVGQNEGNGPAKGVVMFEDIDVLKNGSDVSTIFGNPVVINFTAVRTEATEPVRLTFSSSVRNI